MTTKAQIIELTNVAANGYFGSGASPYLKTSNCDYAFRIGRWLRETGRSAPRGVRPSRGSLFHANEMVLKVDGAVIERIS